MGRSAAARRADSVIARRATEIREHEDALRAVLADFFTARDGADAVRAGAEAMVARVRRDADARIARATERAGREAAGFERRAHAAVRLSGRVKVDSGQAGRPRTIGSNERLSPARRVRST